MTFKTILVHVEPTKEAEARVRCAADLADRFDALLLGCGAEAPPQLVMDPFTVADGEIAAQMLRQTDEHLAKAEQTFERVAAGRARRWVHERSLPDEALCTAARTADLIVASQIDHHDRDSLRTADPGMLVVVSGRPILVTPPGKAHLAAERVLVCWKDAREARRAVSDALPFLMRAEEVLVVEVAAPEGLAGACQRAGEVAESLCRHGVFAHGEGLIKDERRVTTILEDRARVFGADLIVAGGYGRSRLGEWAFGGVTKSLLEQQEHFVLMSH
jgi:nucleotide-binding universal stress UspA family protein